LKVVVVLLTEGQERREGIGYGNVGRPLEHYIGAVKEPLSSQLVHEQMSVSVHADVTSYSDRREERESFKWEREEGEEEELSIYTLAYVWSRRIEREVTRCRLGRSFRNLLKAITSYDDDDHQKGPQPEEEHHHPTHYRFQAQPVTTTTTTTTTAKVKDSLEIGSDV